MAKEVHKAARRLKSMLAKENASATLMGPDGEVVVAFTGRMDKRQGEAFSPSETGETIAAEELRSFVERIERLAEEKKAIADDIRDVCTEAKGRGFSVKAIRTIVRLRAQEPHEREEEEAILDLYKSALGMS